MGFGEGGEPPRGGREGSVRGYRGPDPYRARSIPAVDARPRKPVEQQKEL